MVKLAVPPTRVRLASTCPLLVNCTVPVGTPAPTPLTVTVNVTGAAAPDVAVTVYVAAAESVVNVTDVVPVASAVVDARR